MKDGVTVFDKIEIDGKKVDVYFYIEKFKLKINRYDWSTIVPSFNEKIVIINNFVLFVKNNGVYNNYSYEFDVLFYIHCDYEKFPPTALNNIVICSEEISYLLFSEKKKKSKKYEIKKENCEFIVSFNRSNKIQDWYYNEIRTGGNVSVRINRCNDWETYGRIINAIIDAISVASVSRRTNDFEILISHDEKRFKGSMVFPKIGLNKNISHSLGNIDVVEKEIKKIISELVDTPMESQYIIPEYSNYHNQLDFYKLYACFEFEYKKINKKDLYTKEQKKEIKNTDKMKDNIKKTLKKNNVKVTEHFLNMLANYNPMEGHKQKLKNAIDYSKQFLNGRLVDINFYNNEQDIINYIYETRIKIIHEPDNNIEIEKPYYMDIFNEIVYAMFLKRCNISNNKIEEICKRILIPHV